MDSLRRYLHVLAYFLLAVPLVVAPFFTYQHVFTQVHLIRFLAGLSLMPLVVLWLWRGRSRAGMIAGSFLAYSLGLVLLNAKSINPAISYAGVWERFGSAADWVSLSIVLLLLITALRTVHDWKQYLSILILVATTVALIGMAQKWPFLDSTIIETRIFSTAGNPLFLAGFLMLSTGLTFYLSHTDRSLREWYVAAGIVQTLAIILTITRSGLVGLATAGCVYMLYRFVSYTKGRGSIRSAALLLVPTLILVLAGMFLSKRLDVGYAPSELDLGNKTVIERLANARIAIRAVSERPVAGWGTGAYGIVFQKYYDPALYFGSHYSGFFDYPHNQWLSITVENGLLGLLLWLSVTAVPFVLLSSRARHEASVRVLLAFYAGYLVFVSFSFQSIADGLLFVVYLGLFNFLRSRDRAPGIQQEPRSPERTLAALSVIIGIGFAFVISIKPVVANYLIDRAGETNTASRKLFLMQQATSVSSQARRVAVDRLLTGLPADPSSLDQYPLYEFARTALERLVLDTPYDVRYLVFLAKIYRSEAEWVVSRFDQALVLVDQAIRLSSMDPELYHLRGLIRLDMADRVADQEKQRALRVAALDDFRGGYELAPNINEARTLYAMAQGVVDGSFDELRQHVLEHHPSFRGADWNLVASIFTVYREYEGLKLLRDIIDRLYADNSWLQSLRADIEQHMSEIPL